MVKTLLCAAKPRSRADPRCLGFWVIRVSRSAALLVAFRSWFASLLSAGWRGTSVGRHFSREVKNKIYVRSWQCRGAALALASTIMQPKYRNTEALLMSGCTEGNFVALATTRIERHRLSIELAFFCCSACELRGCEESSRQSQHCE